MKNWWVLKVLYDFTYDNSWEWKQVTLLSAIY